MQHVQQVIAGANSRASEERSVANSTSTTTSQDHSSERLFWAGGAGFFQIVQAMAGGEVLFLQFKDLEDMTLLDSALLAHVFCDEKMVDKTRDANEHLTLATNGGLPDIQERSCTRL